MLFWQLSQKNPVLFWQLEKNKKIKNLNLLGKQLFYQSPNIIWQKNYITLKAQNYSLAKAYFDILNSLAHGKHKLLMTYYPYFETISSTKFMGTMLIFSIRNSNYKSPYILQTHDKTIHFVRMNKPKKANNKAQLRQFNPYAKSQQLKLTWVTKMVRPTISQVSTQLD